MLTRRINYLFGFAFLFSPIFAFADIRISEIMYDLEGSDTDREWIEIENTGVTTIDLTTYFLREANTNHKLDISQGSKEILPGGFAVIADVPARFLTDNPNFSGALFDSSFSLSNTGESLIIRKDDLDIDSVTYSSATGANGDGKTLIRSGSSFVVSTPTPGFSNYSQSESSNSSNTEPASQNNTSSETQLSQSSATQTPSGSSSIFQQQVYANAGIDKTVVVGAENIFKGEALGVKKEPLNNANYFWNFGDGSSKEGKSVSHTYHFPGIYILSLNVSSGEFSQGDTATITVVDPQISIGESREGNEGFISIVNSGNSDIDISKFILQSSGINFIFPQGTIIKSKSTIRFPNTNTKLNGISASLFYPNNTPVKTIQTSARINSAPTATLNIVPVKKEVATQNFEKQENKIEEVALADIREADNSKNTLWIGLTIALVGVTFAGVIYSRRQRSEADLYEIEEVKE